MPITQLMLQISCELLRASSDFDLCQKQTWNVAAYMTIRTSRLNNCTPSIKG